MSKYIIRNCPAIFYSGITTEPKCWQKWEQFDESCQNCTDCVMKQIVEKLKEHPLCDCACGDEILQLLDIQEVKNVESTSSDVVENEN